MAGMLRSCLQSLLKTMNSALAMAGLALIFYALWMLRAWFRKLHEVGSHVHPPWFILTILGLGGLLCIISCSGHIAAATVNGYCLSFGIRPTKGCHYMDPRLRSISPYMLVLSFLLLLEATITADVFLNSHWEEDLPQDETGRLDDLKNFIKSNFKFCRWIGLLVVAAQALSIFIAMVLRALGPGEDKFHESDEEYSNNARVPLLKKRLQSHPYAIDPHNHPKKDNWSRRF